MFFAGCTLLAIPILIPINYVNGRGQDGLPGMSIANIRDNEEWRLWFHLVLTYIFCGMLRHSTKLRFSARTRDLTFKC
jgi:hypothetical protein